MFSILGILGGFENFVSKFDHLCHGQSSSQTSDVTNSIVTSSSSSSLYRAEEVTPSDDVSVDVVARRRCTSAAAGGNAITSSNVVTSSTTAGCRDDVDDDDDDAACRAKQELAGYFTCVVPSASRDTVRCHPIDDQASDVCLEDVSYYKRGVESFRPSGARFDDKGC